MSSNGNAAAAPAAAVGAPIDAKLEALKFDSFHSNRKSLRITGTVLGISRYIKKRTEVISMSVEIDNGTGIVYAGIKGQQMFDKFAHLFSERMQVSI